MASAGRRLLPPAAQLMKLKSTLCKKCGETSLTPVERVFFFVARNHLAAVPDKLAVQRGVEMVTGMKKRKRISKLKMSSEKKPAVVLGCGSKFYDCLFITYFWKMWKSRGDGFFKY